MTNSLFRIILWLHTIVAGLAGAIFYFAPGVAGGLWPWMLPPLAARFVGSLLIGGAICSALTALDRTNRAVGGIMFIAIGDGLIALTGILGLSEFSLDSRLLIWLLIFVGTALILGVGAVLVGARTQHTEALTPTSRPLRTYFALHCAIVAIVGLTMYVLPVQAQPLWPWMMSPINVRLIGGFFVGAALYSAWCFRQPNWEMLFPTVAFYAVFATAALIASFIHFNLFNPARIVTWVFVALYVFVGAGAWWFLWDYGRRTRHS